MNANDGLLRQKGLDEKGRWVYINVRDISQKKSKEIRHPKKISRARP